MKVLSLFDGISCGRLALERAEIKVTSYYASEIDKYAMQVSKKNWPDIVQVGDVCNLYTENQKYNEVSEKWELTDVQHPWFDLLIGGSPCQSLSNAGDGSGFNGKSGLFWQYIRILRLLRMINPNVKFLLENVKMKKEWSNIITKELGVQPILVNSALVSAQNRERYYWTNVPELCQPTDAGIFLIDILEKQEVDDKYYLTEKALNRIFNRKWSNPKIMPLKSGTLNTKNQSGQMSSDSGTTLVLSDRGVSGATMFYEEKVPPLSARTGCAHDIAVMHIVNDNGWLKERGGKSQCLDANYHKGMDNHAQRTMILQVNEVNQPGMNQPSMQNRIYDIIGKSPALTSFCNRLNIRNPVGYVRRLTPVECERLQTLPDNYTEGVSDTQRYKSIGNGWTVDVIAHIFKGLKS